ncbi:calcium-translocating P-type ATPase [Nadsonia fulvescens var. elongata DSM 6958]|uniref:Calcium-transporting ATPase n=1 Tax=Nadsonia fulvescens var. elongata DSM 6958 TaxID=857566 RepID=A0A1E3PJ55_9ASCO|nr:calcium-translocating P-type ATPase [Nadsonia fulvescens var. elongata DSM 6958]
MPSSSPSNIGNSPFSSRSNSRSSSSLLHSEQADASSAAAKKSSKPITSTRQGRTSTLQNNNIHRNDNDIYTISPEQLSKLCDTKDFGQLSAFGGFNALVRDLDTDINAGLSADELANSLSSGSSNSRVKVYGRNVLPVKRANSILKLMWIALNDQVLILLSVAAVISLALGLYQTFTQPPDHDSQGNVLPRVDWIEGVAIVVAIGIVVIVGAINDWQKERQFIKLNEKKEDRKIKAIRSGKTQEISIYDILVGDIVLLEPGDMVPADGLLISGYNVTCDESSATGESDTIKKVLVNDCEQRMQSSDAETVNPPDCFIISGSKILEGAGHYLITAVGVNSRYGHTMASLQTETEETPLQVKLDGIANGIAKLGSLAALVLFTVLLIKFLVNLPHYTEIGLTPAQKGQKFIKILITAITVVVVAVPEGLPLAVTLALAFATSRMLKDNNLVRLLKACETMGGATTVCSDKTGTLTQNKMTVVMGTLGLDSEFKVNMDDMAPGDNTSLSSHHLYDHSVKNWFNSSLSDSSRQLLFDSIIINSSAFEVEEASNNLKAENFIGSKTETALLNFAKYYLDLKDLAQKRACYEIVQLYPFDSGRKCMLTIIKLQKSRPELKEKESYRVFIKGAAEVLLKKCSRYYDTKADRGHNMCPNDFNLFNDKIDTYANKSLRAISLAYRDIDSNVDISDFDALFKDFTLVSILGIMDPLRPGVKRAVQDCQGAGVVVRMITGDNIHTAKAIAAECGIYHPRQEGVALEGPEFRNMSSDEIYHVLPHLEVLARSSPDDKQKLVKYLKAAGETVAVTGDGTNDAPALKLADVGFSMGIAGTEVAKEASAIILMDDNFASIVKAIVWGRTVNDAVRKFLQFQLTVNITAVLLTFVSAVVNEDGESVLTAVQLLWVNLIMDTFAALALATDPPHPDVLERSPDSKRTGLISITMWKMILGQAIFQIVVTFSLVFLGPSWFNVKNDIDREQHNAMVFNAFVWMQFFNMFVNRRLDNKFNMFDGVLKNFWFMSIMLIIALVQVLIMFVGGTAFSIVKQTRAQWTIALTCGLMSLPAGILIRCIPDSWVLKLYPRSLVSVTGRLFIRLKNALPFTQKSKVCNDEETFFINSPSQHELNRFQYDLSDNNSQTNLLNSDPTRGEDHYSTSSTEGDQRESNYHIDNDSVDSLVDDAVSVGDLSNQGGF